MSVFKSFSQMTLLKYIDHKFVLLYLNLKEISGKRGWKIAAVVTNFVFITDKRCWITAVLKNKPCQLWLGESSEC